jgi:hypothetical protein
MAFGDVYSTRLVARAVLGRERERPGCDHPGEAVEDLAVGPLELAGRPADGGGRLPRQHRDRLAPPADRDAEHPHPLADHRVGDLALDDLAQPERAGDQRPVDLVGLLTQQVVAVERLAGRRADLAQDHERPAVLVGGHEQQQVREAEVREEAPRGHQPLEVALLRWGEAGLGPGDVGEAGHRSSRIVRPGRRSAAGAGPDPRWATCPRRVV